ncbi:MAG: RNA-directed DNA polymerase [Planctomycetes bacterium]|nr:RNA-directed DNA polymerase [Planctomycetota bacterium]
MLTVRTKHFYYTFTIPKRRGGTRQIDAPYDVLKGVQAWILRYILEPVALPPVATAFRRRKNLRDNVVPHQGHQFILCIDLEDFFPSIGANKVFSVFRSLGYTNFVSHLLTSLCTYQDRLPQGGVTSPILSNITCKRLDNRFSGYASRLFVSYTRYADDLTFSSNEPANLRKMLRAAFAVTAYVLHLRPVTSRGQGWACSALGPRRIPPKLRGYRLSTVSSGKYHRNQPPRGRLYKVKNSTQEKPRIPPD